jgi:diacylglycerol kinase (ATP)
MAKAKVSDVLDMIFPVTEGSKDIVVASRVKVILNANSGTLSCDLKVDRIRQGMQAANLDYELIVTDHPAQGFDVAQQAALEGWPVVVAAGGDGTINEVVNGLLQSRGGDVGPSLSIFPLGTANDLADELKLSRDINVACQRIAKGENRLIDVGLVNGRYFANNSAVGLEPVISLINDSMRQIKGNTRYILAALRGILQAKPWIMRLRWDTGMYEGPITLVSVGNSPRTGGAFYMTPQAKVDDGLLDFVYAGSMNRWQMLKLLPQTFSGKHIHQPLVVYQQTKSLSITASPATPIQTDGEVFETGATEVHYQILPQKLRVIS